QWTVLAMLLLLGGLSALLLRRRWREFRAYLWGHRYLLLVTEGVFLCVFLLWTAYRAYDPDISHTEQPMDFAFLNASASATFFPPEDPWLRGYGISYYYFAYVIMGLLTKLTGIPSQVTYNLSLSLVAAMASAGVFGLVVSVVGAAGARLRKAAAYGLVGVLLFGVVGNLEGLLELGRSLGVGSQEFWQGLGIKGLEGANASTAWHPQDGWWWWRATRVVDTVVDDRSLGYTIQEFPFFSSLLGDLHPHVVSVPFVLLFLAFAFQLLSGGEVGSWQGVRREGPLLMAMGLCLGALGFLNGWDLLPFLALALGLLGVKAYRDKPVARGGVVLAAGVIVFFASVPFLPYYLDLGLEGQVSGVSPVTGPGTRPLHFFIVWGGYLLVLAPFVLSQAALAAKSPSWRPLSLALVLAALPVLLWLSTVAVLGPAGEVPERLGLLLALVLVAALFLYRTFQQASSSEDPWLLFPLGLLAYAVLLLIVPELFFVVDSFNTRMNTVFKLYYQAWVVLAPVSAVILYYWHRRLEAARLAFWLAGLAWQGLMVVLLVGLLYYPAAAVTSKTAAFHGPATLDGLAYLERQGPEEYLAIRWLQENAGRGEGILEAVGGDYTSSGLVSASTGLPTVLGWPGHELQWRGPAALLAERGMDVATIYQTGDVGKAKDLLGKYDVDYVVVGPRERQAYGEAGLAKFDLFMTRVFPGSSVVIYRTRD
ncbi:MAG: hypothetical protein HYY31_00480, partial [Chloroflexi bacterium]|nr:hypothetical protein [Chloroflexota bacterium]